MSRLATPDRVAGCVSGADATPTINMIVGEGCNITAHAGAGVWAITLDVPIAAAQCCCQVTPRGATPYVVSVEQTSDSVKTVHIATGAGVATDVGFDFAVFKLK